MNALEHVTRSVKWLVPADVRKRMRALMGAPSRPSTIKNWVIKPDDFPWFDRPNALELLAERQRRNNLADTDYQCLHEWVTNGYCIVSGAVSHELIDGMMLELDGLWTAEQPHKDLEIDGLRLGSETPSTKLSHRDVLALTPSVRAAARDRSNWRIHGFPACSRNAKAILNNPELLRLASLILDKPANPEYSINFMYGSTQSEHQDTAAFCVYPPNYIVAAWIACEDISPDSGPLMFYPGSHREPLFRGFPNYPQTNLKTASAEVTREYYEYMADLVRKYDRHLFVAKKGDVLFWHGMVMHGGSEIKNPKLTRRSFVIHYIPPGMDVADQVVGPFNW